MSTIQTTYSIENIIKPILQDQMIAAQAIRKGSYEASDYKIKYKTQKCRYWRLTGNCPFSQSCAFAHGQFQIRDKIHTSRNYKTKLCNKFEETGFCKYGQRCQFRHQMKQIKKINRCQKHTGNYQKLLDSLPQKYSEGFLSKRLKVFEEFELDDFDKVDWHYKKMRLYSL